MNFTERLGFFVLFLILTIITIGFYPIYFYVTQMKTQTDTLLRIAAALEKGKINDEHH